MEAYRALGSTLFHLGEFGAAQAHLEQSLTLYDAQRHRSHVFLYSIRSRGSLAFPMQPWSCGIWAIRTRRSRRACRAYSGPRAVSSIQLGRRPGFCCPVAPASPGKSTDPRVGRGSNHPRARARISRWLGQGAVLQGWALAEQGQSEEGISQIRQGLATQQAVGAGIFQSYYLVLLAEAYGKAGQAEEGLATLAEALAVVDKSGERFYEAELYRLKGELLAKRRNVRMQNDERQTKKERTAGNCPHSSFIVHHSSVSKKPKRASSKPSTSPKNNKPSRSNCAR